MRPRFRRRRCAAVRRATRGTHENAHIGENSGIGHPHRRTLNGAGRLDPCRQHFGIDHHAPHCAQIAGGPAQLSTASEDHCVTGHDPTTSDACPNTSRGLTPESATARGWKP